MIKRELHNEEEPEKLARQTKFTLIVVGIILVVFAIWTFINGGDPVPVLLPPLSVIIPILWLTAEIKKWNLPIRISLGIISMLAVGTAISFLVAFSYSQQRFYERVGFSKNMARLEQLSLEGKQNTINQAISTYNQVIQTGGTIASAISSMQEYLDATEQPKPEENKANALDAPSSHQ